MCPSMLVIAAANSPTQNQHKTTPEQQPPAATALAVVFAHDKVADVPGELSNVGRGFVLNFSLDGKAVEWMEKVSEEQYSKTS